MRSVQEIAMGGEVPGMAATDVWGDGADAHLVVGGGAARCSLWWRNVPEIPGETVGLIGHFAAENAEAGVEVLTAAAERLEAVGCSQAVGPMDGSTWRRYRVLTWSGGEPDFFMEPTNPDYWEEAFEMAGFGVLARYSSSLVTDLGRRDPRLDRARERLVAGGIGFRDLEPGDFVEELRRIYRVSVVSFARNFLYQPVSEEAFVAQYSRYRDGIRSDLVLVAERADEVVGFLFAMPDFCEVKRGERQRTVVAKTLAVLPGRANGGLGLVLTEDLHRRAAMLGYERVIHALEHEANASLRMTQRFGEVMRRYALYVRPLGL